jgi:hypothetical protein
MNIASTLCEHQVYKYTNEYMRLFMMKPQKIYWTTQQLAQYFPDAVARVKKTRKELTKEILEIQEKQKVSFPRYQYMEFLINFTQLLEPIESRMKQIERIDKYLRLTEIRKEIHEGSITVGDISKAKNTPIPGIIDFNNAQFAKCLWHNEKSPSLHYIKNTNKVHCFGCGKTADAIDLYMELYKLSFIEAVKRLS